MKNTKTIMQEAESLSDEYEFYADAERRGEISRRVYYSACSKSGLTRKEATEVLRENYQRAGIAHLF
jgi:hypothetical protein